MARLGRTYTKMTPEVVGAIEKALRAGNFVQVAVRHSGISVATFYNWLARGREAVLAAEPVFVDLGDGGEPEFVHDGISDEDRPYVEFVDRMEKALADAEVRIVTHWAAMAATDWRAGKALAAARWPERWGERATLTIRPDEADDGATAIPVPARMLEAGGHEDDEAEAVVHDDGQREAGILAALVEAGALSGDVAAAVEAVDDAEVVAVHSGDPDPEAGGLPPAGDA